MTFKSLAGREVKVKKSDIYKIDWQGNSLSKLQKSVKKELVKYWGADIVYEEFPVAGTRLNFDFYNATKNIVLEVDGHQHYRYNKFFHGQNRFNFLQQLKRDNDKEKFCDLNGIKLYRVREGEDYEKVLAELDL